jgi:putative transposase
MNKKRFTEAQISLAIKEYEQGKSVSDICRELSISSNTFYRWKNKYSGMDSAVLPLYLIQLLQLKVITWVG